MSGGGGKPQKATTTQNNAPWAPTVPGLTKGIKKAENLFDTGGLSFDPYPFERVAPTSDETASSWDMIGARAKAGSPLLASAKKYNQAILDGDFSSLDPMISKVRDATNANYSLGGAFGGRAHDKAVAEGVGGIISQAQQQASQFAPTLADADYNDAKMLSLIGSQRESAGQDQIDANRQRWNETQEEPLNEVQRLFDLLNGGWGGTSMQQQTGGRSSSSPWMQYAGTAGSLIGSALSAWA